MDAIEGSSIADRRLVLVLVGVFGGAALLLAAIGLYSVVSYLVAQRTQELRVRVALGAREVDIVRLVLRDGTILAAGGIALGTCMALAVMHLLANLLYGISANDPMAFITAVVGVTLVTLAASWLPAHRAATAANSISKG
jgi:ABC-type antimicrobial peptide transport system permease subunit